MTKKAKADPPHYSWGWLSAGGRRATLFVTYVTGGKHTELMNGVPPERPALEDFVGHSKLVSGARPGEVRSGPWDEWREWSTKDSAGLQTDRRTAIPRLIAAHALGTDPSTKQIKAVAALCRGELTYRLDRDAVDAALATPSSGQEALF